MGRRVSTRRQEVSRRLFGFAHAFLAILSKRGTYIYGCIDWCVCRAKDKAKRHEQQRKKEEREALLRQEEKDTPGRLEPKNKKHAKKKTKSPVLSQLDSDSEDDERNDKKLATVSASGIDNALDVFDLDDAAGATTGANKIEKHPERRFKAAYAQYEERRLEEMQSDGTGDGLRLNQRREKIRKEFERHPDNPFNQTTARYNASPKVLRDIQSCKKAAIEASLAEA